MNQSKISAANPLGILGIDHLEFCVETKQGQQNSQARAAFTRLGMQKVSTHPEHHCSLFTQGQIRFVINSSNVGPSAEYYKKHGEGVSKISFLVEDAPLAFREAIERGAVEVHAPKYVNSTHGSIVIAAIRGFGDVINEFVQRPMNVFRTGYEACRDEGGRPLKVRLSRIDHLTNNVPKGELDKWVEFYTRIYGFKVTRYFDIKGQKTGLFSKVVQSHDAQVIIPINEPDDSAGKSQIQEFLELHKGAGVQHIALMTPTITETVKELQHNGIEFLKVPHTYYEDIPKRLQNVTENLAELEERQVLVDGDQEGYLLQNFSKTAIGPLFFEIIQRKNHWGFGEGNFQALFDAIERDQEQRGVL